MIRMFTKTAVALSILACLPVLASAQAITVSPTTIDLGSMEQMQERETSVTITNSGAGKLIIKNVNADCGCTIPTLTKDVLGPGESTVVHIKFNSKKFHGRVLKMVTIASNDPMKPIVEVMLIATIKTALLIDPPSQRVGFTRSIAGEDRTKRVTLTATEDVDLEVTSTGTSKDQFQIKVINKFEGNSKVSVVEVTLPGDSTPGKKRDVARLKTNIEGFENVDLDLRGVILNQISFSPDEVNFRYKKDFRTSIRVSPEEKGLVFKVLKAEIDLPEIQVVVNETIPNKETLIQLTGTPIDKNDPRAKGSKGRIKGTLTIFTNAPGTPVMEIPVSYMIRK